MPQILIFTHIPYITWVFIHDLVVRARVLDLKNSSVGSSAAPESHVRFLPSLKYTRNFHLPSTIKRHAQILMFVTMFNLKTYYLTILTLQTFSAQN